MSEERGVVETQKYETTAIAQGRGKKSEKNIREKIKYDSTERKSGPGGAQKRSMGGPTSRGECLGI